MQSVSEKGAGQSCDTHRSLVHVVVAYDDYASNTHAFGVIDRARHGFGREIKISISSWSFVMLQQKPMRSLAVLDAVDADVIFIVSYDPLGLPAHIAEWLDDLAVGCRACPPVLMALLTEPLRDKRHVPLDLEAFGECIDFQTTVVHSCCGPGASVPYHDPLDIDRLAEIIFRQTERVLTSLSEPSRSTQGNLIALQFGNSTPKG
jgi:hypothetical protein